MKEKILIFDPDRQFLKLRMCGCSILDNTDFDIEYCYETPDQKQLDSNVKKILIKNWWLYVFPPSQLRSVQDYSWADLIICVNTEVNNDPWPEYHYLAQRLLNNKNIIHLVEGKNLTGEYSDELFFSPMLYFFLVTRTVNRHMNVDLDQLPVKKKFTFDALLGADKIHRRFIFENLVKHDLLNKSLSFFYSLDPKQDYVIYESPELPALEHPEILRYKNIASRDSAQRHTTFITDLMVPRGGRVWVSTVISPKIYDNSWFSIVAETCENRINFLTEKTAKCLLMKRIFICFSAPHTLRFLQQQGFKTFNGIIDESYDQEPDDSKRFNMAFEQVKFLSTIDPFRIYKQVVPILEHNYHHLMYSSLNIEKIRKFVADRIDQL